MGKPIRDLPPKTVFMYMGQRVIKLWPNTSIMVIGAGSVVDGYNMSNSVLDHVVKDEEIILNAAELAAYTLMLKKKDGEAKKKAAARAGKHHCHGGGSCRCNCHDGLIKV